MDNTNKKIAIIIFAILAVGIAIFSVTRTITSQMPRDAGPLGGGKINPNSPGGKAGTISGSD